MRTVTTIPANYVKTGVRRFDGNPFIEALPSMPDTRQSFLLQLTNNPDRPTAALRGASEVVRIMELSTLGEIVYPFPIYEKAAIDLARIIRESYVGRNPLTAQDIQRRHALATTFHDGLPFPSDWKSTAYGHCMLGITGMGKSTFCNAFLLRYPQVIEHTSYDGQPFCARQVVYIILSVPHDATLKSLCIQFFKEVDRILGKEFYTKSALNLKTIALMVQLMHHVATTISLGMIIIDDVQHLGTAAGPNAVFMLNLFSEIMERLGIALFLMATPAIDEVLINIVRNTRKSVSSGCTAMTPMRNRSKTWNSFCHAYWNYTFTKHKKRLTVDIADAWYKSSAGDTAFAALAFLLTQRNAIGGVEAVTADGFRRTAATDMAILQPAIAALRSGKIADLARFDDLLFGKGYIDLMHTLKTDTPQEWDQAEEFDEIQDSGAVADPPQSRKKKNASAVPNNPEFPVENPLGRYGR
jgi:hypothetical protein